MRKIAAFTLLLLLTSFSAWLPICHGRWILIPIAFRVSTGAPLNLQQTLNAVVSRTNSIDLPNTFTTASIGVHSDKYTLERDTQKSSNSANIGRSETWGDSHQMADNSPRTETSTEIEGGGKIQAQNHHSMGVSTDSDLGVTKTGDSKTLRRLAQNREAARKSRLRKKAYVQQLESSRMKLSQLEQELQRARQQGFYLGGCTNDPLQLSNGVNNVNGALNPGAAFDMEYARWMEEHERQMADLRAALQTHVADNVLRVLVETMLSHYDDVFRLKSSAAKQDVFHLVSGMWKSPAERCFLWMGGFRPSELLKIVIPHLEPVTDQQLVSICSLQQSSQQAEDALSQGMEALQQSLSETLSNGSLGSTSNVANYMGQMAMAMGKLGNLESFVRQADNLRQQTLQQMHRILTTRQSARGLLAMGEYCGRLRALSSLWSARPRE
ncbi:hypothetical protein O6H91_06G073100 [Diphasiastrum complanatum]|uniref:Uncharacterized protein n=1 Tax=Diphasiastrum complanatum TaxID=34168 RepID=A0ACC2DEU2_DIPCM|nr:hypothetical protein O6H91_06G073100 [Diphasiastrum complanatum]